MINMYRRESQVTRIPIWSGPVRSDARTITLPKHFSRVGIRHKVNIFRPVLLAVVCEFLSVERRVHAQETCVVKLKRTEKLTFLT